MVLSKLSKYTILNIVNSVMDQVNFFSIFILFKKRKCACIQFKIEALSPVFSGFWTPELFRWTSSFRNKSQSLSAGYIYIVAMNILDKMDVKHLINHSPPHA